MADHVLSFTNKGAFPSPREQRLRNPLFTRSLPYQQALFTAMSYCILV